MEEAEADQKLTKGTDPVVLDIDATLTDVHSENKEGTGPNDKGGYGFHDMGCWADATGETLSMLSRPGNAGANDAEDHLVVLDAAIAPLPGVIAAGHRETPCERRSADASSCAPTQPVRPRISSGAASTATSASRSRPGQTPRSTGPSGPSPVRADTGNEPGAKTAGAARERPCAR